MRKDLSPVYDLIRADGSIVINKNLSHAIGLEETIVYSELLSRYNYFCIREELDEEGYFFNTVNNFELGTTLSDKVQKKAISNLVKLGLIKEKIKGMPAKRYFYIIDDMQILLNYLELGRKKKIELEEKLKEETKKSLERRKERLETKRNQLFSQNGGTSSEEIEEQVPPNGSGNNTKPIIPIDNTKPNDWNESSEIRDGIPNGDTKSLSYHSFLLEDIKKYDTKYRREIIEFILYYNSLYLEHEGKEHYRYGKSMLKEIYSRLDTIFSIGIQDERYNRMQNDIELDTLKELAEKHFNTKYSKKISWTLLTFLNDKIMVNRYYELYGAM